MKAMRAVHVTTVELVLKQFMEPLWGHLEDLDRKVTQDTQGPRERKVHIK